MSFLSIPFPASILVPVDMLTVDCAGQCRFHMVYGEDDISIRPHHIFRVVREVHAVVHRLLIIALLVQLCWCPVEEFNVFQRSKDTFEFRSI